MTQPNCIYGDASIDNTDHTFFHCEKEGLGVCTIENFCDVIMSSEKNWNSVASYTEALLISKKFDLDERIRMDV